MSSKQADKARNVLVSARKQVLAALQKIPDGEIERVVRFAEFLTAIQNAVDAVDKARDDDGDARGSDRRAADRRRDQRPDLIPPEGDRRKGSRRTAERREPDA